MIDYELILKEFKKYLEKFNMEDFEIQRKIKHSYFVADLGNKLGKRLELSKNDLLLSKTIGLLHDIGRFPQYEKSKMYNDYKSKIDHAKLGTDYLFKDRHIKDFGIPDNYYTIIKKAIENHNKYAIEENLGEKELFFAKLIRDIDKIDIYRLELSKNWYFNGISKKVKDDFYKHKLIHVEDVRSKSDAIVLTIANTFDINFKESYELLKDTDNLELYLSVIEVEKGYEEEFESIKQEIRNYLEERIEEKC